MPDLASCLRWKSGTISQAAILSHSVLALVDKKTIGTRTCHNSGVRKRRSRFMSKFLG